MEFVEGARRSRGEINQ